MPYPTAIHGETFDLRHVASPSPARAKEGDAGRAYPSRTGNLLLSSLPAEEYAAVEPCLERLPLKRGDQLLGRGKRLEHIYLLESGIACEIGKTDEHRAMHISVIGREGLVGAVAALGAQRASHDCIVEIPGRALRIETGKFIELFEARPLLRARVLAFVHSLLLQSSETALSNGLLTVERRLARVLLMCNDRLEQTELRVTHGTLSAMLGVRRASVTVGLHLLEGERMIRSLRGRIILLDRAKLEDAARGCYGLAEAASPALREPPVAPARGHALALA